MAIRNILIHVEDVARSVEFYCRHLGAVVVGDPDDERALLDVVTATLEIRRLERGRPSVWNEDDTQRGFRHLGFKVADVDVVVAGLDVAGVPFRSRPQELEDIGVRIAFFFDPDGTVIELVERHVKYHVIHNEKAVEAERRMPTPGRPRFDHVGHTVADLDRARKLYEGWGFVDLGSLHWDVFRIDFLRSGSTIVEVFSHPVPTTPQSPSLDTYGFLAVSIEGEAKSLRRIGMLNDGREVHSDDDDLPLIVDVTTVH